ncbi:hypothetical protein [Muricoccus aerilatus]|uniref:hypothetical protein n=1 Tax=Muricoccus aerilatus TaxID=452982 RepID=UPI0012EB437F|nr:hypothetical protein [Roseomonas aerilata]
MAYVELRYYRAYALEIREFGDTGWAVHVYTPSTECCPEKLTIVDVGVASDLEQALAAARSAVDDDVRRRHPRSRHVARRSSSISTALAVASR